MSNIGIRRAVLEDIPDIQALYVQEEAAHRRLYPDYFHEQPTLLPEEILREELQDDDCLYLVATAGRQVVGFIFAKRERFSEQPHFRKVEYALIEDCVVLEAHRRQGIATELVEGVRRWAEARGLKRVQLQVWAGNEAASRLYRKLGFAELIIRMESATDQEGAP